MRTLLVTRHQGAKNWLISRGIQVDYRMTHLELDTIEQGDLVIGSLPIQMVADLNKKGAQYVHLVLTIPESMRGKELSADMMESCGARLQFFEAKAGELFLPDQ